MTEPRHTERSGGEQVGEQGNAPAETKPSSKTLRELERLQFDALDRANFPDR